MTKPVTPTARLPASAPTRDRVRRFRLTVVEGESSGTEWSSSVDRCSIGSHPGNDLVVEDETVSRFHCELVMTDRGARVRDLDSSNGTSVDGVVIYEAAPRGGSLIRIGRTVLRFEFEKAHNQLPVFEGDRFGPMVGRSVATRSAFATLAKAASSSATVLVEGETGTGKELAARAVHDESDRAGGPFVVVDCGAIPDNLLESELFGYEKGAFTGADSRRTGAFEEADGGTVFLDEIGELSLSLQPKLLRVLESREIRPVGSTSYLGVDVRIVAATNRDLRSMVNEGTFRADLFYRLGVIKVRLPALRERPEDLSILVDVILDGLDAPPAVVAKLTEPSFVATLATSAWTGNVRELRNFIERCVVFEEVLSPTGVEVGKDAGLAVNPGIPYADARRQTIAGFEREYARALLAAHDGNVSAAARAAGIGRVYLHKLIKRHELK